MKRRVLLSGLVLLVLISPVVYWLMQPTDPINAANFDRILDGMTQSDVAQILGGPPSGEIQMEIQGDWLGVHCPSVWNGQGHRAITVYFRMLDGTVVSKQFFDPSFWERAKAWWGAYELTPHPVGGRAKRLNATA